MRAVICALALVVATGCDDGESVATDAAPADGAAVDMAQVVDLAGVGDMAPIADADPDSAVDAAPEPVVYPAVAADNAVDPDDPLAAGQHRFVYETWGAELSGAWPPADFLLALMVDEPEVFGEGFSRFGFVADPNDALPFGLARGSRDPALVFTTCATCHIARLPDGRVWLGAPNSALDLGALQIAVNDRWTAAGNPPLSTPLALEKAALLGPGRTGAESGDYPQVVPADFPPYFRLASLPHLNYLGTGRDLRTEVYLSIYSAGPGNPNDETAVAGPFPSVEVLDPLLAFMGQMQPPGNPAPPAADRVARGAEVFVEARCDACHAVGDPASNGVTPIDKADDGRDRLPGEDDAWPDGSIHTSPLHRVLIDGDGEGGGGIDEGRIQLIRFIGRHGLRVGPTDGYRVPPLRGLWATAPYLHNGSVPTLEALLDAPADRPAVFAIHGVERDTAAAGNRNRGHAFGIDLTPDDKAALVAWLRSL